MVPPPTLDDQHVSRVVPASHAAGDAALGADTNGGQVKRPSVLLRVLVAILRLLPYAIRSRIGAFGFLDPRGKRKKGADRNTLVSRHRLEYVIAVVVVIVFCRCFLCRCAPPPLTCPSPHDNNNENDNDRNLLGMGIRPAHLPTYHRALTHPSAVINRADSFERLELLGDGVLTLVARELLLERLPSANEGMITIQTSALVSNECISSIAQWLGVGRYIRGHCIDADNSRGILCDSFEALVGAVYTDKGLEGARAFITRVLKACPFAELESMRLERNYVAELKLLVRNRQSRAFRRRLRMARSVVSKKPKNGRRTALPRVRYRVEIHDERTGEVVGVGESYTVVIAEQYAAKEVVVSS